METQTNKQFETAVGIADKMMKSIIFYGDASWILPHLTYKLSDDVRPLEQYLPQYLKLAVIEKNIEALQILLSYQSINPNHHVDINQIIDEGDCGYTALNFFMELYDPDNRTFSFEVIKLLLDSGANPHIPDVHGFTPLHNAALNNDPKLVRILLEHHANPNETTNNDITCFEWLMEQWVSGGAEPENDSEEEVLACMPAFLDYHAKADWNFYETAENLGFTRVTALLDNLETKKSSCPIHMLATYESKDTIVNTLKTLSFNDFKLKDTHGNTPSDIARRMNDDDEVADVLEKYEAVYNRHQLMRTNYISSGLTLNPAVPRCIIASFLTPREFSAYTAVTNMHISRNEQQNQNIQNDINSSKPESQITRDSSCDSGRESETNNSQTNSRYRLFSLTQGSSTSIANEHNSVNDTINEDNEQQAKQQKR